MPRYSGVEYSVLDIKCVDKRNYAFRQINGGCNVNILYVERQYSQMSNAAFARQRNAAPFGPHQFWHNAAVSILQHNAHLGFGQTPIGF